MMMKCPRCGNISEQNFCSECGSRMIELVENNSYIPALNEKYMNKHVFVWVGAFLFGGLGVDRFMRGQVGLGILKIITIGGLGVWSLVDWIISMTKVYGSSYANTDNVIFIDGKYKY